MDVQVAIMKIKTDPKRVEKALTKASEILNGKLPKVTELVDITSGKS